MIAVTQGLEIVDFGGDRDILRSDVCSRFPAASLVVIDKVVRTRQAIHLGEEIALVEVRTAVKNDDRAPLPDVAGVERHIACDRNSALMNLWCFTGGRARTDRQQEGKNHAA